MRHVICDNCGSGTSIEDNEIDSVAFCVHCGSKLPKTTEITKPITEDGIILEYYVNAAENELYGNKSQAEEMYYKILKFRSDFIPAKNGLDRLKNGIRSMVVIPGSNKSVKKKKKVKDNVMVKFNSVPPYYNILVDFDSGKEQFKLNRGYTKVVTLAAGKTHTVSFNLGKRHYVREFYIRDENSFVEIRYLFNGVNHITIEGG